MVSMPHTLASITEREYEVFMLLVIGNTTKEIAEKLFVSTKTVESHLSHIYHKLGVTNMKDAILLAVKLNLITLDQALISVMHPAEAINLDIKSIIKQHMNNMQYTIEYVCVECRKSIQRTVTGVL